MPDTLQSLKPWLTPTLPTDWTGISCSDCYIFLPSLLRVKEEGLPIVPPVVHDPSDEYVYDSVFKPDTPWV